MEKIKLLITARDPATADAIRPLLASFSSDSRFQVDIVAENPAFKLLLLDIEQENIPISFFPQCFSHEELVARCSELILAKKPDAVLTGISGPDVGVDEGILDTLGEFSIPSYSIQSYWGDINETFAGRPRTIFVIDDYAARFTRKRCNSEIVITGALKYADFKKKNPLSIRKQFEDIVGKKTDEKLLGFFGQPLSEIYGYSNTIERLSQAIEKLAIHCRVVYRPHPKETEEARRDTISFFQTRGLEVIVDENEDAFPVLCGVDVALSVFSTCGYDAVYLNRWSGSPLNTTLFLMYDPYMCRWYRKYSKLSNIPMDSDGIVSNVSCSDDVENAISCSLDKQYQRKIWEKIVRNLPDASYSVEILKEKIYSDQMVMI